MGILKTKFDFLTVILGGNVVESKYENDYWTWEPGKGV